MSRDGSVDVVKSIREAIDEVESYLPSNAVLNMWFQKKMERGFYGNESHANQELEYEMIQLQVESLRRTILHIDTAIDDYFVEIDDDLEYYISHPAAGKTPLDIDSTVVEKFVRDVSLTNRVLTFYNTYMEMMKIRQSWLLLRGVFGRSIGPEQEKCMEYLHEQLAYEQREHLLFWSGIISDTLRGNMARLRGRRNNIIHNIDAGHLEGIEHAINDLDLAVEVMQELSEMDMVRTPLGRFDTISEAWDELNQDTSDGPQR